MLETIMNYYVPFYLMGSAVAVSILSKCISHITLKRLVKAASTMNKSTHRLMRLLRAKFEHACMVSDKVQNVRAFVEKYMYEYCVAGLRLHTWRRLQIQMMWFCGGIGILAAGVSYIQNPANEDVFLYAGIGGIEMMILFLIHIMTDESYQLEAAKNYMVDYLENICAHKYAKTRAQELKNNSAQMLFDREVVESFQVDVKYERPRQAEIQPADEEVKMPVVDVPEEAIKDAPVEIPVQIPAEVPSETPTQTPAEVPAQIPEKTLEPLILNIAPKDPERAELERNQALLIREILEEFLA